MIFLVAAILSVIICFAGIPAAINRGNEEHVKNGRQPNAGVAFAPDLLVMIPVWSIGTWMLDRFLGRDWAWGLLLFVSAALLGLNLLQARRSTREYLSFIRSRSSAVWPSYANDLVAAQCWTHPNKKERLFLIVKPDGTYTTDYEQYSSDTYDNCWIPYGPSSIYDSEATAIKEAIADHRWMADVKPQKRETE
ncbi:MAG: hypothetical protein V4727_00195 [Verrucomicrobiota bacterium]